MTIKHAFQSAKSDGADATMVRPSNWNADHELTGAIPVANGGTGAEDLAGAQAALGILVPSYGGAYEFNEAGSQISMASKLVNYQWVTGQAGTLKGTGYMTWDATGKTLVVGANGAGVYLVNCAFAGTLDAAADVEAMIYKGAAAQDNLRTDQAIATQAKYQAGSISGLLTLAAGDTVSVRFSSSEDARIWTVKHLNLALVRVG